jgi:uncharacterized heparinase superfamily protein
MTAAGPPRPGRAAEGAARPGRAAGLARLGRTVVQLRPGQVAHRARLRAQRAGLRRFPGAAARLLAGPDPSAAVGWPDAFRPLDAVPDRWPDASELQAGKITLLGVTRSLDDAWQHAGAPRLWRFHLHYWDWAGGLGEPDGRAVFARLWRSWQASADYRNSDAWHPYPAALRAWSWCGLHRELVAGSDLEPAFTAALAAHAGFLRRHLEYDVGGNHLIKGLKAVTGLAVFLGDERLLRQSRRRLARQVRKQVLGDGGHFERAPAYHVQVLADLIDVANLLQAAGREPDAGITAAIEAMRRWLAAVLTPGGQVPLLNDGYPVDHGLLAALRLKPGPEPAPAPAITAGPLLVLPETGLVRAVAGGWHLLADVGPPCPRSLPAHAHADTFGCLVHVDGVPLLADTGTSTYEPGPVRGYERSTAAHSTVQVDGADSTEVWGTFRAGRRARVSGLAAEASRVGIRCEAVHDGFRHLPGRPRHRRRWTLTVGGLLVEDAVTGRGRHEVVVRWQLAPGWSVRVAEEVAYLYGPAGAFAAAVTATVPVRLTTASRPVAAGFEVRTDAPVLICRADAPLPVLITTAWSRTASGTPPERT